MLICGAIEQQEMQNMLQTVQYQYGIYNAEIEPEHETEYVSITALHRCGG